MVNETAYRVIKRACIIRIQRGENAHEVVASYTKLTQEQMQQMYNELVEEGIVAE